MKTSHQSQLARILSGLICALTASPSVFASTSLNGVEGVTRLSMGIDVSNGIIAPAPASRVRVPPNECVVISRTDFTGDDSAGSVAFWTKDGETISGGDGNTLTIPLTTSADSGFYSISGLPEPFVATGIHLDVVTEGSFANQSARVHLPSGNSTAILGFVIEGTQDKLVLVRGVGPSLARFGMTGTIAEPEISVFDRAGTRITTAHPEVIWNFPGFFAAAGAFPLYGNGYTSIERFGVSFDWMTLPPGAYTVQLRDLSQQGGHGLIEVYEIDRGPGSGSFDPEAVIAVPSDNVIIVPAPIHVEVPEGNVIIVPTPTPVDVPADNVIVEPGDG